MTISDRNSMECPRCGIGINAFALKKAASIDPMGKLSSLSVVAHCCPECRAVLTVEAYRQAPPVG